MPEGAVKKINKSILFPDSDCREGARDRYSIPVICILTERWGQITHRTFKVIYVCEQNKDNRAPFTVACMIYSEMTNLSI